MKKVDWQNRSFLEKIIKSSFCYSDVLIKLKLRTVGRNNETLKKWIDYHKIDISHFDSYRSRLKLLHEKNTIPLTEILSGKHPQYKTYHLKQRLLKEGLKKNCCEQCGLTNIWNNKPIAIQLDHINGNSTDHRLENLRMLCPNCHSQTATFAGKNK